MRRLAKLHWLVWIALLALVWWALTRIPFDSVWNTLFQVNLAGLMSLIALDGIIVLLFSSRAWLILRAIGYRVNYLWLAAYRS